MKSLVVIGRLWFDKVNGNTYHSVNVYVDGKHAFYVPLTYGYGNHYLQTAGEELEKRGLIKLEKYKSGGKQSLWQYCKDNNIVLSYEDVPVSRKKDL